MELSTVEGLSDRKMYGEMCHKLAVLVQKIIDVFPALEAVKPRQSGMQALCGLHWALDKSKSFLQQIVHSSKLYLAITSDSVLLKFEKVKECLDQSLRRLQTNLPESLAEQVAVLLAELQETTCQPDAADQEAGDEIISLLQKVKEDPGFDALTELEVFDQVASKLGITTSKAVLAEKKALRRLLDKVRNEDDKKKELIVLYLLHLLRKYSKAQKFSTTEDGSIADGGSSCPPSPSERGSEASTSGRDSDFSSDLSGFEGYNKRRGTMSCLGNALMPPEEFRCPISLQLMADPVIISSGQTYERVCIEKWFEEGNDTCPKTQQKLAHLAVTPNYCVKGLITSWCERHSLPLPSPPSPPPSPIANWRWDYYSESPRKVTDTPDNGAMLNADGKVAGSLVLNLSLPRSLRGNKGTASEDSCCSLSEAHYGEGMDDDSKPIHILAEKLASSSRDLQYKAAEEIRFLTKDSADARLYIGQSGLIPGLVGVLSAAIEAQDEIAQETACLALSNVALNNNRNTGELINSGVLPLLLKVLKSGVALATREAAIVVLLTASCLEENKPCIGSSGAITFLVNHLDCGSTQGVKDALTTLYNLSTFSGNSRSLIDEGVICKLISLLSSGDTELAEKCIAVLFSLCSTKEGRCSIAEAEGSISVLVEILDSGTNKEKEQIVGVLLLLCTSSYDHTQLVLQEGVIPSLVMLSVNGTARGKVKATRLLQHFREQRQKESMWHSAPQSACPTAQSSKREEPGDVSDQKLIVRRKARSFGFFRRSRSLSFYRC